MIQVNNIGKQYNLNWAVDIPQLQILITGRNCGPRGQQRGW